MKDAARRLDMSETTLRGHVRAGDIAYVAIGLGKKRKRIKFTPDDIEAFKREQRRREIAPCQSTSPRAVGSSARGSSLFWIDETNGKARRRTDRARPD
jgi:hypothetical protein